ncbi:PASTA domain-containing protein [Streptosporangiaceae bacterium NEAU-GS5]|nr:PASTA domain-containing protein [Streptosporangiaceae bacterium NEAU-GS5]
MGYGETCMGCPTSPVLLTANTVLVSDDDMSDEMNPLPFMDNWIPSLMIGGGSSTTTTCRGDSGAPLIVHRQGVAVEVGLDSFGYASLFDNGCDNPDAFTELSGPQLAWVANIVPQVAANWGTCIAADGFAGTTYVGVTMPNLLGRDEASARAAITGSGLTVGTVSHRNDCVDPGNVETQNPSAGDRRSREARLLPLLKPSQDGEVTSPGREHSA